MTDDRGYMGQHRPVDDLVEDEVLEIKVIRRGLLEVYVNGNLLENIVDEDALFGILWTLDYCGVNYEVKRFVYDGDDSLEIDDDLS